MQNLTILSRKSPLARIQAKLVANEISKSLPKIKIELVVDDDLVNDSVEAIKSKAHTGRIGDGKIFVSSVDEVVRIRTGEKGKKAI